MKFFDELEDAKEAKQVIWIGYDPLEDASAKVMAHSIRSRTKMKGLKIIPIIRDQLLAFDIFRRPLDPKESTQFSITRFLVPSLMNYKGVGIFFDCDMLITRDIQEMFDLFDPQYAIQCVKHNYTPSSSTKMGGQEQTTYMKKNWSSVIIYNCDHPSTQKLTNKVAEKASPKFLHRFEWLKEEEVGSLPLEFNFLVEEQKKTKHLPFNIHHTLGGPIFREKQNVDYASYFKKEFKATFGREFAESDIVN